MASMITEPYLGYPGTYSQFVLTSSFLFTNGADIDLPRDVPQAEENYCSPVCQALLHRLGALKSADQRVLLAVLTARALHVVRPVADTARLLLPSAAWRDLNTGSPIASASPIPSEVFCRFSLGASSFSPASLVLPRFHMVAPVPSADCISTASNSP